jgi:hypothetical protein
MFSAHETPLRPKKDGRRGAAGFAAGNLFTISAVIVPVKGDQKDDIIVPA